MNGFDHGDDGLDAKPKPGAEQDSPNQLPTTLLANPVPPSPNQGDRGASSQ